MQVARECQVFKQCEKFVWAKSRMASTVKLTLYFESLCPDCKDFFRNQLSPTYSQVASIMDLQLVPYGNAMEKRVDDEWVFKCQHGDEECTGNIIETCTLALTKFNMSKAFPMISCMEAGEQKPEESARQCAKKLNVDVDPIITCSQSSLGNQLEHEMALLTEKLNPPHQYVPWITLNGVHTEEIQRAAQSNLLKLICDSYKGQKPGACVQEIRSHNSPRFSHVDIL